jgi:NAD(P)-dependent dehydrogenase (short-subunit alcohol dehydrogenase family)
MNLGLYNKRALVTASTAGIGFAIARSFAAEGAAVWINGRTQKRVDAAIQELGGRVQGVAADLSTAEGCEKLFAGLPDIDILVNNLGIFQIRPFLEISDDESEVVNSLVDKHAQQLGVSNEAYKRDFATNSSHANLIRRFAKAEEVAHMATYLCSELASVTTGSPIRADGGTLRSAF